MLILWSISNNMINVYLDIEMDRFCRHFRLSFLQEFNIDIDFYVSKKKKSVRMCLLLTAIYNEIIYFVNCFWQIKNYLFLGYYFIHLVLNEGQIWKRDYIFIAKNEQLKTKWTRQVPKAYHLMC